MLLHAGKDVKLFLKSNAGKAIVTFCGTSLFLLRNNSPARYRRPERQAAVRFEEARAMQPEWLLRILLK